MNELVRRTEVPILTTVPERIKFSALQIKNTAEASALVLDQALLGTHDDTEAGAVREKAEAAYELYAKILELCDELLDPETQSLEKVYDDNLLLLQLIARQFSEAVHDVERELESLGYEVNTTVTEELGGVTEAGSESSYPDNLPTATASQPDKSSQNPSTSTASSNAVVEDINFRMKEPSESARAELKSLQDFLGSVRYALLPAERLLLTELAERAEQGDFTDSDRQSLEELRGRAAHAHQLDGEAGVKSPYSNERSLSANQTFFERWQNGDPALLDFEYEWWNDLYNIKNDIRVSLSAAGYTPDEVRAVFVSEINPWAERVATQRREKSFSRGAWGELRDEILSIMRIRLEGRTPDPTVFETEVERVATFTAPVESEDNSFETESAAVTEHYEALFTKLSPLRDEYIDQTLALVKLALEKAQNFVSDDRFEVERMRRQYLKTAKKNLAKLRSAEYFVDGTIDSTPDVAAMPQAVPSTTDTEIAEPTYADLVQDGPKIYDPNTIKSSRQFVLPETDEPTYIDIVKDDPQFKVVTHEPEPIPEPSPASVPVASAIPSSVPKKNLHETVEYWGVRDEWRVASREYRNAATAYEQAYDHYLRTKGVGRKLSEKVQTLLGKEVTLPPDLHRLQGEYRSAKRQYAESLAAALAARSGVYDGNKNFSLDEKQTKIAFGYKFISRPRVQLNAIKAAALEDEATRSRLLRVMQFMGKHRTATRVVGLSIATSVGALTGGALGAGISASRWALGVFGGAAVAAKVSQSMQVSVEQSQARHALVEVRAQNEFSLANLDAIDREVDTAAFEVEKMKAQQTAYTLGSAALFAGSTAYAASFIPRDVPEFPIQEASPRPEAPTEAIEGFNGIPFARVPMMEMTDLRTPNGVALPPIRLTEIALVAASGDGLPTDIYEIAKVRGEMLAAVKDFLAERPNISKEQLETAVFDRLEAKYGSSDWWQTARIKEMHIGDITEIERTREVSSSLTPSSFIQYGEVVARGAEGQLSVKDINFIGTAGSTVEIPDAEVYQVYGAIKATIEKIIAERPEGLTKLDLEQELYQRMAAEYGNTAWWKAAALEKVQIGSFSSVPGEPPVAAYPRETVRINRPLAAVEPQRVTVTAPDTDSLTQGGQRATPTPAARTEAVTPAAAPRFNVEISRGLSLTPHSSEVLKMNIEKLFPEAKSVQVGLKSGMITTDGFNEKTTTLSVSVLMSDGKVVEATGVGFGTLTQPTDVTKLLTKALDELRERSGSSVVTEAIQTPDSTTTDTRLTEPSPRLRPGTGRLNVAAEGASDARPTTVPIENRIRPSRVSVLPDNASRTAVSSELPTARVRTFTPPPVEYVASGNYLTSESFARYLGEQGITYDALRAQVDRTIASFEGKTYAGFWDEMKYRSPYQELGKLSVGEIEQLRQNLWNNEAAIRQYAIENNFKYETLMKWSNQIDVMKLDKTLSVNENTPLNDWVQRYIAAQMVRERAGVTLPTDAPRANTTVLTEARQSAIARPRVEEASGRGQLERHGISEAVIDRRVRSWIRSIERGNPLTEARGTYASPYKVLEDMTIEDVNRLRKIFKADPTSLQEFAEKHQVSQVALRKWFGQIDTMTNNSSIPKVGATFSDWFRQQVATEIFRSGQGTQGTINWTPRRR